MNTILNQPYRHRVLTNRLNSDVSQLVAPLEGEPGPASAERPFHTIIPRNQVSEGEGTSLISSG